MKKGFMPKEFFANFLGLAENIRPTVAICGVLYVDC